MEPKRYGPGMLSMLGIGKDPFREGLDGAYAALTAAGRFRQAMKDIRDRGLTADDADFRADMDILGETYLQILSAGYRMCEATAYVYVLGMVA